MYGSDVCVSRTLHLRAYRHRRTQHPANTRHADVSCVIDDVTGGGDVVDDVTGGGDVLVDDVVNSGNDATAGVCDDVLLRVLSLLNVRDLTRCQRGECAERQYCNSTESGTDLILRLSSALTARFHRHKWVTLSFAENKVSNFSRRPKVWSET